MPAASSQLSLVGRSQRELDLETPLAEVRAALWRTPGACAAQSRLGSAGC
jgi:hypothetical protein